MAAWRRSPVASRLRRIDASLTSLNNGARGSGTDMGFVRRCARNKLGRLVDRGAGPISTIADVQGHVFWCGNTFNSFSNIRPPRADRPTSIGCPAVRAERSTPRAATMDGGRRRRISTSGGGVWLIETR
jgi:hypothetical protein